MRRLAAVAAIALGAGACSLSDQTPADAGRDSGTTADSGDDASLDDATASDSSDATHDAADAALDAFDGNVSAHSPYPNVSLHGSSAMSSIKIVSIVASNDALGSQLFAFGDALVASSWWTTVAAPYALGAIVSHTKLTGAAINANVTIDDIQTYIRTTLSDHAQPAPDGHTIYVLYLPDGIWGLDPNAGANTDCKLYGGWHYYDLNDKNFVYALVQQCPNGEYIPGLASKLETATHNAAHEIVEAATDPHGDDGWSLYCGSATPPGCTPWAYVPAAPGETGDLCAWTVYEESGWKYTRVWSNAAANAGGDPCVPAIADAYVCASTQKEWYAIQPGQTLQVTVDGWSSKAASAWQAFPYVALPSRQGFSSAPSQSVQLGDGSSFTLDVTAPQAAQSGDYAVIDVSSYTASEIHPWAFGVYVP